MGLVEKLMLLRHFWSLLPLRIKFSVLQLVPLIIIAAAAEAVSIGLIVPFLILLSNQNLVENYPASEHLISFMGYPSQIELVTYGLMLLLSVYILKALYLLFYNWRLTSCIFFLKTYISNRLFEIYMNLPYSYHVNHNSSLLLRNITIETQQLVGSVFAPSVFLVSEVMIICAITITLLFIEPIGALSIIFGSVLITSLFYLISKNLLKSWGEMRQVFEGGRIKRAQEGLHAIKEVKIYRSEDSFLEKFSEQNSKLSSVEGKSFIFAQIPRIYLELIGVISLTSLSFVTLINSGNIDVIIPTIGVFGAAVFRILPSASRILASLQSLKYASSVLTLITKELGQIKSVKLEKNIELDFSDAVELKNISFTYDRSDKKILEDISIKIQKGESIGIIGESGSGKSTLLDILLGLLEPSSGEIFLDGASVNLNTRSWRKIISCVQQNIVLLDDSIENNIAFGVEPANISRKKINKSIQSANLTRFLTELPHGLASLIGERGVRLSGGQRQRIGIARALYNDPEILIFDEATSALDLANEKKVISAIKKMHGKRTMIIIAHRLSTIAHCDKVFEIRNGRSRQVKI